MQVNSTVIGYPYIGENREWKRCVESFWKGNKDETTFLAEMKDIRTARLKKQAEAGLDLITTGDFTFYDRLLDLAAAFGMVPDRYKWSGGGVDVSLYYAMARGTDSAVACEMTKWFNTNYHYIVPEYENKPLSLTDHPFAEWVKEAVDVTGKQVKAAFIGPFTFVQLTKGYSRTEKALFVLQLLPLYAELLKAVHDAGAEWIQLEEPALVQTLSYEDKALVKEIYHQLSETLPNVKILVQTYFEAADEVVMGLPVAGIGLDFVNGAEENIALLREHGVSNDKVLAVGIINGRDIWRANLAERAAVLQAVLDVAMPANIWIQSSCSLQHVPVTIASEQKLETVLKNALSFADEKLVEIEALASWARNGSWDGNDHVSKSMEALQSLERHASRNRARVRDMMKAVQPNDAVRPLPYPERQPIQKEALQLPDYPTTTIGSFPQSAEVKKARKQWRSGELSDVDYQAFLRKETARWIQIQEEIGLDVLVHGEFERTDMVEFFGEKLEGFAFTEKAWVVSYGSRCVKPPIIYGDVEWTGPMTVAEVVEAQQSTDKPVKGMLTGPVTILNWSFVRDDVPRADVAAQIALALREEVQALEAAGISIIQVDEPALREGLPLRKEKWADYLQWSVFSFKLATAGVKNETQIHTHMCYCEFNDFLEPIRALDADVISIETSRSHGELIQSLQKEPYELGIGLGVYDIHSPRVPSVAEMETILEESRKVIQKEQFWVNPDCGLKTRGEEETVASLHNMVKAAANLRQKQLV